MIPFAALEEVVILGAPERTILAGVTDGSPAQSKSLPGQTDQVVTLLVNPDEQLWPPTRVRVRGRMCRVLGSQSVPWPGMPALVTCEQANPELPDRIHLLRLSGGQLNPDTALIEQAEETIWSGEAHIVSGVPWAVETGGEETSLDKATVSLPADAPYAAGLVLVVDAAPNPSLVGVRLTLMGEVLDSTAAVRRVVGYRKGE